MEADILPARLKIKTDPLQYFHAKIPLAVFIKMMLQKIEEIKSKMNQLYEQWSRE